MKSIVAPFALLLSGLSPIGAEEVDPSTCRNYHYIRGSINARSSVVFGIEGNSPSTTNTRRTSEAIVYNPDMGTEHKGADPKTIRLNDADNPDRHAEFEKALERSAGSSGKVLRQLVDAYIRYVNEHGHSPIFPVTLISAEVPKAKKRQ